MKQASLGTIGKGLMAAAKMPGVGRRALVGAGIGAAAGVATGNKDSSPVGRALGGAALGAAGGAMTSKVFRAGAGMAMRGAGANVTRGNVARALNPKSTLMRTPGIAAKAAPTLKAPGVAASMASSAAGPLQSISTPKHMEGPGMTITASLTKRAGPMDLAGKVLKSAPMGRVLGGAAIGAGLGYATKPEGSSGTGRAMGGALLGAAGGAASSKGFRGNLMRSTGFSKTTGGAARAAHDPGKLFKGMTPSAKAAPAAAAAAKPTVARTIGRGVAHVGNAPEAALQAGAAARREMGAGFKEVNKPGIMARVKSRFGGKPAPAAAAAPAAGGAIGSGLHPDRSAGVAAANSYLSKNKGFGDRLRSAVGMGPKAAPMSHPAPGSMTRRPGARVAREPGTGLGTNLGAGKRRDAYLQPHQSQAKPMLGPGVGSPQLASQKLHDAPMVFRRAQ